MAFAAPILLDNRPAALGRPIERRLITGDFFSASTSGKKRGSESNKTENLGTECHRYFGCGIASQLFSRSMLILRSSKMTSRALRVMGKAIQCLVRRDNSRVVLLRHCMKRILGFYLAAFLSAAIGFGQQNVSGSLDGKQIFLEHCAMCHGEHGEGITAAVTYGGPSLQAEHNPGKVITAVEVGPEHMPRFEYVLSIGQIRAVADYVTQRLAVIPLTGGNLSDGGELFRTYCATCHRTDVRGGALAFVGTNAPSLVQKSPELIAGAIRWGPGPMPKFPPSVLSDEQVASIVQYIRTVQHPANPGGDPLRWYGPTSEGFAAWVILLVLILFAMWAERGGHG